MQKEVPAPLFEMGKSDMLTGCPISYVLKLLLLFSGSYNWAESSVEALFSPLASGFCLTAHAVGTETAVMENMCMMIRSTNPCFIEAAMFLHFVSLLVS